MEKRTWRVSGRAIACLLFLYSLAHVASVLAQKPAKPEAQQVNKLKPAAADGQGENAPLPACLEKLSLSQPQQAQAREITRKYDAKLDAVWKQFGDKYLNTIRTEVAYLAAVEDGLTELQRVKVREQRRKVAHAEQALEGTKAKPNQAQTDPADPVDLAVSGAPITLTDEQETAADKIHQNYVGHLRSLNRDIQGLHTRLVSLEADKLVELEKLLTKEQLAQLREHRLTMTGATKVTALDKGSKNSD